MPPRFDGLSGGRHDLPMPWERIWLPARQPENVSNEVVYENSSPGNVAPPPSWKQRILGHCVVDDGSIRHPDGKAVPAGKKSLEESGREMPSRGAQRAQENPFLWRAGLIEGEVNEVAVLHDGN